MQGRKVFLVGMSPFFYGQYHKRFTGEGSEVFIVDRERLFLEEIERNHPDVVVVDSACLSGGPDYFVERLMESESIQNPVEVVFLVDFTDEENFKESDHRFFSKLNFTPREIIDKIKNFLKNNKNGGK
ncbi:hypothetical protein ACFL2R_01435 [Patescibacteria group bacterium]